MMENLEVEQGTVTQLKKESLNVSSSCNCSYVDVCSSNSLKGKVNCIQDSCIIKSAVSLSVFGDKVDDLTVSKTKSEKQDSILYS